MTLEAKRRFEEAHEALQQALPANFMATDGEVLRYYMAGARVADAALLYIKALEAKRERQLQRLYCSFCGKAEHEVIVMIAGPCVFICDECVGICSDIVAEKKSALQTAEARDISKSPDERSEVGSSESN